MSETETIQVMGRGANVDFTIDDTVPYEVAAQGLRSYLSECDGLYSRGTVSVNVGRRILEAAELSGLKRILDQESGLTVSRYWCAPEIIEEALRQPPAAVTAIPDPDPDPEETETLAPEDGSPPGRRQNGADSADGKAPAAAESVEPPPVAAVDPESGPDTGQAELTPEDPAPVEKPEDTAAAMAPSAPLEKAAEGKAVEEPAAAEDIVPESTATIPDPESAAVSLPAGEAALNPRRRTEALVLKTTCRSGEVIRYPGDVVALADVNPGAEIIADGDIIVFGALRGLAHAGAAGDLKATIIALNLESSRIQIGPHIGEAPRSARQSKTHRTTPQVAYVRRRSIFVAPFTRRQDEYQGGILYEG